MFCGLLIILLHIFELWIHLQTVPPTIELSRHTSRGQRLWRVFAHWIALLPVLFDSLKLDGVKQVGLTPEAPDSNHTLTWHSGLLYCGAGDYFFGLAGWVWSGRQGEVRSWSWVMMELESASNRGELGAVGDSLQPQTPSRHEKSLGLLTTKFVTLLQEAKDGVLDLKAVSMQLEAFCC